MFGCIPELLSEHPSVEDGYKFYKKAYQPIPSERRFRPITLFCAKFFLPWVCSWYYDYNVNEGSPILIRRFKVKWWDAFKKEPQCSLPAVEEWFKSHKILPSIHQNKNSQFLAQRARTIALLASAQTQEEYLQILQSLAPKKDDESVSSNSSSTGSSSSPVISLGNDNEDDCFGILPPVKHWPYVPKQVAQPLLKHPKKEGSYKKTKPTRRQRLDIFCPLLALSSKEGRFLLHLQETSYKKTKTRHLLSPSCTTIQRRKVPPLPRNFLQEDEASKTTLLYKEYPSSFIAREQFSGRFNLLY